MTETIRITEVPVTKEVEIDWNRFTWGDLLKVRQAESEEQRTQVMGDLITKLVGEPINELPALAVVEVTNRLAKALGMNLGESPDAKN